MLLHAESTSSANRRPRAKSVIFLYQFGGPSHLDTFDMKPDAPDGIRSLFSPIASRLPGVPICDQLPRVADVMDKVTLVRTVHHSMKNHNPAAYYALTGRAPPIDDIRLPDTLDLFPAYGSIVDRFVRGTDGLPPFVSLPYIIRDGSVTPGQRASFLGPAHDPLIVTGDPNLATFEPPELSLPETVDFQRLQQRRELQSFIDRQRKLLDASRRVEGMQASYERAYSLLDSPQLRRAFNIGDEPDSVRERYGRSTYGQSCLLARRLVESGVKFVNVYFSPNIGGQSFSSGGWDTHGFNNTRMYPILKAWQMPLTDQTLPMLLNDLDERGLLDETLVVWMGEFGRTPRINDNISRDHWPHCYTVLLAGGGVKRGFVYGASDHQGAYPERDPVRPDDLSATMFSLLGMDPHATMHDRTNRPFPASDGRVIEGILA